MDIIVYIITAVSAYLLGGINPSILLSKLIYHEDIRTQGSKNPGFTNFKRTYGSKYAWFVFFLDLLKAALACVLGALLFNYEFGLFHLGGAYAGFFAMIGHAYPVYYAFHGGKGFLVAASAIWFIDWRVALISMCFYLILLFSTHYMSLSVMLASFICPFLIAVFGFESPFVLVFCSLSVALMIYRHKENIYRLLHKSEKKFYLFKKEK